MRFILILLLSVFYYSLNAQHLDTENHGMDSLRKKFQKDSSHTYRPKNFRLIVAYDSRNSFIKNEPVNFYGMQLGVSYKDKHTVGFGGYRITQSSSRAIRRRDLNSRQINEKLTLNYGTVFYQYMLLDKRFFEIDLPVEFGFGKANVLMQDALSGELIANRDLTIFPLGAGLQAIFKPIKWVGVTFLTGYRFVQENERGLNFNGMYYSIGVWLDFRQVLRDTKFYGFQRPKYRKAMQKLKKA